MPTYIFNCEKCKEHFETFMRLSEYKPEAICPTCKCISAERVYTAVNGYVAGRTLGAFADKKADKMSADERKALHEKHNEYKKPSDKPLPKGMKRIPKPTVAPNWG